MHQPVTSKNVIYFSTYIDNTMDASGQMLQLHYALHTLSKYIDTANFDTIVFYDGDQTRYESLCTAFQWVTVRRFKFDSARFMHHYAFHKWSNLLVFSELGYERILYLDNDVIFNADPSYLFDRYADDAIYTVFDKGVELSPESLVFDTNRDPVIISGHTIDIHDIIGYQGINSGQMLFTKGHILSVAQTLLTDAVTNYAVIRGRVSDMVYAGLLDTDVVRITDWVGEQYAGGKVFTDHGIRIAEFDSHDVKCTLRDISAKSTILHYIGRENAGSVIPNTFKVT